MKADLPPFERLAALFAGSEKASGTHGEPDPREGSKLKWSIKKTARTVRQPATFAMWRAHVAGERALGVIPTRHDGTCSWGSIDIDQYDVDLLEIVRRVEKSNLPLVSCVSKSGGLHLFIFLAKPAPAGEVQAALCKAAAALDLNGCEVFPKQARLDGEGIGNWMVMPYFGGTFGGKLKMQHGLKKTGAEMTIEEFLRHAESSVVHIDKFSTLCNSQRVPRVPKSGHGKVDSKNSAVFSDGPPCLQHLTANGAQLDGRKRTLFMMALYFKRRDAANWKEMVEEANRKFFSAPMGSDEVSGILKSVGKRDYEYTCKEEPMRSACNSALCRTRKYGVGGGSDHPIIVNWRKISSDNPVWYITIDGSNGELEIRRIDDITNNRRFNDQCAKQLNRFFPPMKATDWAEVLSEAAATMVDEPAVEDTTREGAFREQLEEFLTNRTRGQRREDILSGRPWEDPDKKRHEFRMQDLHRHLVREGVRDVTRHECEQWIKNLGGGRVSVAPTTLSGKGVRLWFVPTGAVTPMPTLETPSIPGSEI